MVKISGVYEGDLHCQATHGPSGIRLATDAPKDNQGKGESFSPTDLVATALGTCIATTLAMVARKHGVDIKGLRFEVTKEMTPPPRRIARLSTQIWVPFGPEKLPPGTLEHTAENCPVHLSLHPSVDKPIVFHWTK